METTTSLLSTIALWAVFGGICIFGVSLAFCSLAAIYTAYANSDSWRRVARDLEKECECLNKQNTSLSYHLNRLKDEIENKKTEQTV
jgi:hypothetical protein